MWERDFTREGRRLHARLDGPPAGKPTYVLEAGLGVSSPFWAFVQRRLAAHALTLSYDRAGYGDSDKVRSEAIADQGPRGVADLKAVLDQAALPGPVILVGHSAGGLWARLFTAAHPEMVRALVLLDPTPLTLPGWSTNLMGISAFMTHGLALFGDIGLLSVLNPFTKAIGDLPPADARTLAKSMARGRHLHAMAQEFAAVGQMQAAARAAPLSPDLPVLVISAGDWLRQAEKMGDKPGMVKGLLADHEAAARGSTKGRYLAIDGATHIDLVADDRYAAPVVEAIEAFVADLGD